MNNRIRVVYITYDGIMEPIGNSQVLTYLKQISRRGIDFDLISFEKYAYSLQENVKKKLQGELAAYGIKWHILRYHRRFRILATAFDIMSGIVAALFLVKPSKADILHARSYIAAFIAWIVCMVTHSKFVFDMRGFWPDERVDAGLLKKHSILYKIIKKFEALFITKANGIVVLTNRAGEEIETRFPYGGKDRIKVIPCCADTALFRFDREARDAIRAKYNLNGRLVFIHTGSLIGWYMIPEMLEYFKTVKGLERKAVFMLLTHSAAPQKWGRMMGKSKYAGALSVPGHLGAFWTAVDDLKIPREDILMADAPFEEVYKYLSSADAGLFFIKPTFSKSASCPVKFAEYLSCGLPVICNRNIGDLDGIVEANRIGVLVEGFNANAYNDSYRSFLALSNDSDLRKRCRTTAEELFRSEKGAESYLDVYRRCQA